MVLTTSQAGKAPSSSNGKAPEQPALSRDGKALEALIKSDMTHPTWAKAATVEKNELEGFMAGLHLDNDTINSGLMFNHLHDKVVQLQNGLIDHLKRLRIEFLRYCSKAAEIQTKKDMSATDRTTILELWYKKRQGCLNKTGKVIDEHLQDMIQIINQVNLNVPIVQTHTKNLFKIQSLLSPELQGIKEQFALLNDSILKDPGSSQHYSQMLALSSLFNDRIRTLENSFATKHDNDLLLQYLTTPDHQEEYKLGILKELNHLRGAPYLAIEALNNQKQLIRELRGEIVRKDITIASQSDLIEKFRANNNEASEGTNTVISAFDNLAEDDKRKKLAELMADLQQAKKANYRLKLSLSLEKNESDQIPQIKQKLERTQQELEAAKADRFALLRSQGIYQQMFETQRDRVENLKNQIDGLQSLVESNHEDLTF